VATTCKHGANILTEKVATLLHHSVANIWADSLGNTRRKIYSKVYVYIYTLTKLKSIKPKKTLMVRNQAGVQHASVTQFVALQPLEDNLT